jgi:single-strand DNA-binding protein
MSDLNLCTFIGRLGADPETRYMPDGTAVTNFSIAVGWKTSTKEGTEWVRICAYDKLAEICGQYLVKGKQVHVMGQMRTRKWTDREGVDRYTTEIRASQMQMLSDPVKREPRTGIDEPSFAEAGGDDIPF